MADSRVEKWRRWCEERVRPEVLTMHLHRDTYQRVGRIVEANGELPASYFWEYMRDTYAATQAVAIRLQAEATVRVVTLGRLVAEVKRDAARLDCEFWLGMWDADDLRFGFAQDRWAEQFAGDVGDHLDPAIPERDLDVLRNVASAVKVYVDQHVAHSDARPRVDHWASPNSTTPSTPSATCFAST